MMDYLHIAKLTFKNMWLLNPTVRVPRVDNIDYQKMKSLGIKYIVFDKDNTLTAHLQTHFFDDKIKYTIENNVKSAFDENKQVFLVSNSKNSENEILNSLQLQLISTKTKKPHNFREIIQFIRFHNQGEIVQNNQIAFIGDRLFTDVLLANSNGAISILTEPLSTKNESIGIYFMRKIEQKYLQIFGNNRSSNLHYSMQKIDLQHEIAQTSNLEK